MQLWCLLIIIYKPISAVEKASNAHKRFSDFLVSIKNAQCPVFAWLLTWFKPGLLSSFQRTVDLIIRFFQRRTCFYFPFYGTEMLLLWMCSGAQYPSGAQGALPAPFPSPGRAQGSRGSSLTPGAASPAFASLQPHLLKATKLFYEKNLLTPSSKNHGRGSHPLRLPFRSPLRRCSKPNSPLAWAIPSLPFIHLV